MRLSWAELYDILSNKLQNNDYQNMAALLENVVTLNESFATKPEYYDRIDDCVKELLAPSISNDLIAQHIQALCDQMQIVIKKNIKPLMSRQKWYMNKMKALGYKIYEGGECYGISYMAIQAFFMEDIETFNKRLKQIYDIPIDDFNNDFANLREKKQQFLNDGRQNKANEIDQIIVDLYAFFDGVMLHQSPFFYLHDEDYNPISRKQNAIKTIPITIPVNLETKNSVGEYATNLFFLPSFEGVYSQKDLIEYLDLLKKHLGNNSFACNLTSLGHAITLTYDAKSTHWLLIDPENLPGEEYIGSIYLARAIFSDYTKLEPYNLFQWDTILLTTQIISASQNEHQMRSQLKNLQKSVEWSILHDASKMNQVDSFQKSLNDAIARDRTDATLLEMAVAFHHEEFVRNLFDKRSLESFMSTLEKMEPTDLISLLDMVTLKQKNDLLEMLSISKKVNILSLFPNLFNMLSAHTRLSLFPKLQPYHQIKCLAVLPEEASMERNMLIDSLSIQEKTRIFLYERLLDAQYRTLLFDCLPFSERIKALQKKTDMFLTWEPREQGKYLAKLPEGASTERNKLLESLDFNQQIRIMLNNYDDPKILMLILESIPKNKRYEALIQEKSGSPNIMYFVPQDVKYLRSILYLLTEEDQLALIKSYLHKFKEMPVTELKEIFLKNMNHANQITTKDYMLDIYKQIPDIHAYNELEKLVHSMNVYTKFFDDFSSITDLIDYQKYPMIRRDLKNQATNFREDEKSFLINTVVQIIKNYVIVKINDDFSDESNHFIDIMVEKYANKKSFVDTIAMLSTIATFIDSPDEHQLRNFFNSTIGDEKLNTALDEFVEASMHRKMLSMN